MPLQCRVERAGVCAVPNAKLYHGQITVKEVNILAKPAYKFVI